MNKLLKTALATFLAVLLAVAFALPSFAAETGKLTVTLEDAEKNQINGVTVSLCRIAILTSSGYQPTSAFENSGISLSGIINNPNELTAKTLFDYVKTNNVETISKTSEQGRVSFSDLDLGIWLVFCNDHEKYTFNPHLVFLPFESSGKLYYEISSAPKVQDSKPNEINVYVIKKWDDKNNAAKKRPESITVELLNGDTVAETVELNEANGWAYTFCGLPKDGTYSVREKGIVDYKETYSGDAVNGFVITNTYIGEKLPVTGQYWWPIGMIAVAGVCLILLGVCEIGVKKHDKKK